MSDLILVAVDGSPAADAAVDWAAEDAARRDATVHLVHVVTPWIYETSLAIPPGVKQASIEGPVREAAERILADAAARAQKKGATATTALLEGEIGESLQKQSRSAQALVVGARGHGGFKGLRIGSVSMRLVGHCPGPVIVVREPYEPGGREIVVGVDGSQPAQAAVTYAFEEARLRGVRLRVLQAWQTPGIGYGLDLGKGVRPDQKIREDALAPQRERHPEVEVAEETPNGHPVSVLADASAGADLVVVGSRGHGRFGSAILGSVSHGVLHHAQAPVAVVRPR